MGEADGGQWERFTRRSRLADEAQRSRQRFVRETELPPTLPLWKCGVPWDQSYRVSLMRTGTQRPHSPTLLRRIEEMCVFVTHLRATGRTVQGLSSVAGVRVCAGGGGGGTRAPPKSVWGVWGGGPGARAIPPALWNMALRLLFGVSLNRGRRMTFLDPLVALIPKAPFSLLLDFGVRVTSGAGLWGPVRPFWGRSSQGALMTPPPLRPSN